MFTSDTISIFDWLSFFAGGATGSAIIQGVILLIEHNKEDNKKNKIKMAFQLEVESNIELCNFIINSTTQDSSLPYSFAEFDNTWLKEFKSQCIDYSNKDSLILYKGLDSIRRKIGFLKVSCDDILFFCNHTPDTHSSFLPKLKEINKNIRIQAYGLKLYFEAIKFNDKNEVLYIKPTL